MFIQEKQNRAILPRFSQPSARLGAYMTTYEMIRLIEIIGAAEKNTPDNMPGVKKPLQEALGAACNGLLEKLKENGD